MPCRCFSHSSSVKSYEEKLTSQEFTRGCEIKPLFAHAIARQRLITLGKIGPCLFRSKIRLRRPSPLESFSPCGSSRSRHSGLRSNPAFSDSAFVSLRFVLRDAETNQAACHPPKYASGAYASKGGYDRTGCDERTDPRDSDSPYTTSHPRAPPITAPVPAPAEAPSGAFVAFS